MVNRGITLVSLAAILAALMALRTTHQACSAEITVEPDVHAVHFDGQILTGDAEHLRWVLRTLPVTGRPRVQLWLNSRGGDFGEGLKLAFVLTEFSTKGWSVYTMVGPDAECNSACIAVFAAGETKFVVGGGSLAVHRVSEGHYDAKGRLVTDGRDQNSVASQRRWADILKGSGAPPSIVRKALTTNSPYGTTLTRDELRDWGVQIAE